MTQEVDEPRAQFDQPVVDLAKAPVNVPDPRAVAKLENELPGRMGTGELGSEWRWSAGLVGCAALLFGCVLAWQAKTDGVAVAAILATAALGLTFALTGVTPTSLKLGDVEMKFQEAQKAAKEEGRREGAAAGLQAATALRGVPHDQLKETLKQALTSEDMHLQLPTAAAASAGAPHVLRLPAMEALAADDLANTVANALGRRN